MGNIKRLIVVLLVGMIAIGCVACSRTTSEESSKVNLKDMTVSEKVDYFITKGKDDYETVKNDDDKLTDLGSQYIKDISKYVNNETQFNSANMEDIMTKGSFLEQYGKDKMEMFKISGQEDSNGYKTAKAVNSLGINAVQMVKYVYREAETKEDDSTKANIKQVKESLGQLQ